ALLRRHLGLNEAQSVIFPITLQDSNGPASRQSVVETGPKQLGAQRWKALIDIEKANQTTRIGRCHSPHEPDRLENEPVKMFVASAESVAKLCRHFWRTPCHRFSRKRHARALCRG